MDQQKPVMKKVFVLTMFGSPFPWIQEFIDHVQHLEQHGWYWKIFTPNPILPKGNVEIVPMTTNEFNDLVFAKTGARPKMFMTSLGVPSVHVTDFYVATGKIFEDYLKDADFWGITNLDVVYGRVDRFVPDQVLQVTDIFTDDTTSINGVFSLYRNTPKVNDLFMEIPDWKNKFEQNPCARCCGLADNHTLYGTDEYDMTEVARKNATMGKIRLMLMPYYPFHSHDRLQLHVPDVQLEIKQDGSLWELQKDTNPPNWIHARPIMGREIPYFHFLRTKEWPKCLKK